MLTFCVLLAGLGQETVAQHQPRTATPLGVAGGGPAYVRAQEALFMNPANLTLRARSRGSVIVGTSSLSIYTGGDLYRLGVYDETFTGGRSLTDADVDAALTDWFGSPQQIRVGGAYADFTPLVLSYHQPTWAAAVAVRARLHARIGLNRGWLDLALRGSRNGQPTPLHADWRALSTVDVTVAYSRQLADGRWHIGVAPKLVLGTEFLDTQFRSTAVLAGNELRHDYSYHLRSAGRFVNQVIDGNVDQTDRLEKFNLLGGGPYVGSDLFAGGGFVRPFRQANGVGSAMDVGVSYQFKPRTLLSASFTDVGVVRWNRGQILEPAQTQVTFEGLNLSSERLDAYDNDLGAYVEEELVARLDTAYTEFSRREAAFTTALPAAAHLGIDWRPRGPVVSVNGGFSIALNDHSGNISRRPVAHVGSALRLGGSYAVVPRAGMRVGGASALVVAGGIGVRTPYLSLDVGLSGTPYTEWVGRGGRYTLGVDLSVTLPDRR